MDLLSSLAEIHCAAEKIVADIKVLGPLSWPMESESEFLSAWERGETKLPQISYTPPDHSEQIAALNQLIKGLSQEEPLSVYTRETLESFILAAEMVQSAGTPRCQELSLEAYGQPTDPMPGMESSLVSLAAHFLAQAQEFVHPYIQEPELCYSAQDIQRELGEKIQRYLGEDGPEIVITPGLAAKATASASTVRLRDATCFSNYDTRQLFVHEVMTHSLTQMNGKAQPHLKLLGQGAPRTTETQEGLAAFSEVITGAIDIKRLTRLSLRIVAIHRALKGANFVETFQFFLDQGESPKESFWSSARIFRGGFPNQQIIFTKDSVYLKGLIKVHTLFRWCLIHERLGLTHLLFCGRLALEDLFRLEAPYLAGQIAPPKHLPPWYEKVNGLAGMLSFNTMLQAIDVHGVEATCFQD